MLPIARLALAPLYTREKFLRLPRLLIPRISLLNILYPKKY